MTPDYETDPRPFAELLADFGQQLNGGKSYGARKRAAEELRVSPNAVDRWMDGRGCALEASMRRLMAEISRGHDTAP
jgi:hypothetical protein